MTIRRAPERPRRSVRLTDSEWRVISAAAAQAETYPSTYLREAALREARRELATAPAAEHNARRAS